MNNLNQFKDLIISKKDLLKCIFCTLIFQILVTTLIFNNVRNNPNYYKKIFDKIDTIPLMLLLLAFTLFLILLNLISINSFLYFLCSQRINIVTGI